MKFLKDKGIPVRCVPGITAASGVSAELGIPLTHRSLATGVRLVTGHFREGMEEELEMYGLKPSCQEETLVIYMGLQTLSTTVKSMISRGQDLLTPSVAVKSDIV